MAMRSSLALCCFAVLFVYSPLPARGSDAPAWMHAAVNAPLPPHDEKTDAVLLYSEDITVVQPDGKIKSVSRRAYKILRPGRSEERRVGKECRSRWAADH